MTDRPGGSEQSGAEIPSAKIFAFPPRLRFVDNPCPDEPSAVERLSYELITVTVAITDAVQEQIASITDHRRRKELQGHAENLSTALELATGIFETIERSLTEADTEDRP